MSMDTWLYVDKVVYHSENDGAAYLRKGAEGSDTEMPLKEAVQRFGREFVSRHLREMADSVDKGAYDGS